MHGFVQGFPPPSPSRAPKMLILLLLALLAAAYVIEIVDPAPMEVAASMVSSP